MTRTIEVEVDETGIHPLEPSTEVPKGRALLVWQTDPTYETMLLSEAALAENWLGPEEDAAWAHLRSHGIRVDSAALPETHKAETRPIWEVILENMEGVSPEEFAKVPNDGASEHDHYLYGHPKRNQ